MRCQTLLPFGNKNLLIQIAFDFVMCAMVGVFVVSCPFGAYKFAAVVLLSPIGNIFERQVGVS